jgi:hypothetical protein
MTAKLPRQLGPAYGLEYKRWVVQGIVKRVDMLPDKTTHVKIEFDDTMLEGEQLSDDLCIKYSRV